MAGTIEVDFYKFFTTELERFGNRMERRFDEIEKEIKRLEKEVRCPLRTIFDGKL